MKLHAWTAPRSLISLLEMLPGNLTGIEIGTMQGGTTINLLKNIPRLKKIYTIDPYLPYKDVPMPPYDKKEHWENLYKAVCDEFQKYGERVELIRGKSAECVSRFQDPVDFVFIDGDHSYEAVLEDITLYEPKIRKGGLLIGHDYNEGHKDRVIRAVDEYVAKKQRMLFTNKQSIYFWKV